MYAILAEDPSDLKVLAILIRRIAKDDSIRITGKGYQGAPEMLKQGAKQLKVYQANEKIQRYVICYDSDGKNAEARRQELISKIVKPANIKHPVCALVPIQEIEAWIMADMKAVKKVITSWDYGKDIPRPEMIESPKEHLEKLSRQNQNQKPRYSHAMHNEKIAVHLDLESVKHKCPSFSPLVMLVNEGVGNVENSATQ